MQLPSSAFALLPGFDPDRNGASTNCRTSYRIFSSFICPYLYRFHYIDHEYFPIARISRMGNFLNHVDDSSSHLITHNNF